MVTALNRPANMSYKKWLIMDAKRHLCLCAAYRNLHNDAMWKRHMNYAVAARKLARVL